MKLSSLGIIANVLWHEIKNHAQNVNLGAFLVMPNHIHGILILNKIDDNQVHYNNNVETKHALSLQYLQIYNFKNI
jgi:putative transposase